MRSPATRCVAAFAAASVVAGVLILSTDLPRVRHALSPRQPASAGRDLPWLRDGAEVEFAGRVWTVVHAPEDLNRDWTVLLRSGDETAYAVPPDLRPAGSHWLP